MSASRIHSVMAEFDDVDSLMVAAAKVRDAGFRKWDCHTPFPVHGLDDAMGVRMTKLPWIVLALGLTGCGGALLLQWWTNAVDYPFRISGKPFFSVPANIPVTFEGTVLFSAFTAFFAMWIMNDLPRWFSPLFRKPRFARATDDRFFVVIEAADPQFETARTTEFLQGLGAGAVEPVEMPDEPAKVPSGVRRLGLVSVCAALVPLAMVYHARVNTTAEPRVHLVPDMDKQPRFRAQGETSLFADGRMSRVAPAGTVARGQLREDEAFFTGKEGDEYVDPFPAALAVDDRLMDRGQERFEIYCSVCHDYSGRGDGTVTERAQKLVQAGAAQWVPPANLDLTAQRIVDQPNGQIFETITAGRNTMPGYAVQIPPRDRWAVVLYVRALQRAQISEEGR